MKCFQCDAQAVAICNRCGIGQCEKHMKEDLRERAKQIGFFVAGCTHRLATAEFTE